jgi:hypothetical protein
MNVLILISWAAIDHLQLVTVYKDTSSHGMVTLVMVFTSREDCEDSSTLAYRNTFRVSFVGPHDVRKALMLKEIRHCLVPKTYSSSTTQTSERLYSLYDEGCDGEKRENIVSHKMRSEVVYTYGMAFGM